MSDEQVNGADTSVEDRARAMGWVPQENFRGDPERWISAETFVERGEKLMPILQANNRRLQDTAIAQQRELADAKAQLRAAQEAISELRSTQDEISLDRDRHRKTELAGKVKEAREAGDVEAEADLSAELGKVAHRIGEREERIRQGPAPVPPQPAGEDPVLIAWQQENEWYGRDLVRTSTANAVAQRIRQADPELKQYRGRVFLDEVARQTAAELDRLGVGAPSFSKVEGAESSGGRRGPKGWSNLPDDVQKSCDRMSQRIKFGEGRQFKDLAAYRQYYADQYFKE